MALLKVTTHIDATPARVWDVLLDWEGSSRWMVDATTVRVVSAQREGVGTRIEAITRIAGAALRDVMDVTRWEPGRLIQVHHRAWPIRGVAWFEVRPDGNGTRFEWAEELDAPLGPLGELGALALKRPLERVLRKSLVKLRRIAEQGSDSSR